MRRPADALAGAETVGALLLFGIFVGTIAFLNVTAVPQAGLAAEEAHLADTLGALNALQASSEQGILGGAGSTVGEALLLGPRQEAADGLLGFFMATPARASGELVLDPGYGNITVWHYREGSSVPVHDVGSPDVRLPIGRIVFDPHPVFRPEGVVALENGALLTTERSTQTLRHAPPILVTSADGILDVTIPTRILHGAPGSIGGSGSARLALGTEAATLTPAHEPNAQNVTLRLETALGSAWGAHLNATARAAGLAPGAGYVTTVAKAAAPGGLDVVTWRLEGTGTGNDVRLTTGLAVLEASLR